MPFKSLTKPPSSRECMAFKSVDPPLGYWETFSSFSKISHITGLLVLIASRADRTNRPILRLSSFDFLAAQFTDFSESSDGGVGCVTSNLFKTRRLVLAAAAVIGLLTI